jgi:predicted SPOUT superfamily RNA methylase MTH1
VQDDLKQIRADYRGPKYPGYEILLAESLCELVAKASDYLSIGQSQNSHISIKRLTERVKDLEFEIKEERTEH